eukprot:403343419
MSQAGSDKQVVERQISMGYQESHKHNQNQKGSQNNNPSQQNRYSQLSVHLPMHHDVSGMSDINKQTQDLMNPQSQKPDQQQDEKSNRLKNRLNIMDFDDCFHVVKSKDYIKANKKNIITLSNNIEGKEGNTPNKSKTLSPTRHHQIVNKTSIEREKEKMQQHLDKIKRIILSNPYKYSNYVEHNSALVPEKLINKNQIDPSPVFEDDDPDYDDDEQKFYNQLAKDENLPNQLQQHHQKLGKKGIEKLNRQLVKQYQLYKKLNNIKVHQQTSEMTMPIDFKEKLELIQEEKLMFSDDQNQLQIDGDLSPIQQNSHNYKPRINSQNDSEQKLSSNNLEDRFSPGYYTTVKQKTNFQNHQRSTTIMDTSVQKLELMQNSSTLQFPELSGIINPIDISPSRFHQPRSYLPNEIKQYLQKKHKIDLPSSNSIKQQLRKQINRTSLDSRTFNTIQAGQGQGFGGATVNLKPVLINNEFMNHSSILLKQAKDIIQTVNKTSHTTTNIGLLKLQKDLRNQIIQESPSQMNLQRDIFDNYENFKQKSRLIKFQVEDLYIKRENVVVPPMDFIEELEQNEEHQEKEGHFFITDNQTSNHQQLQNINQSSLEGLSKQTTLQHLDKNHLNPSSAQNSNIKLVKSKNTSPYKLRKQILFENSLQYNTNQNNLNQKSQQARQGLLQHMNEPDIQSNMGGDLFDLNNNIQKFSYQNMRNDKELRELKLQNNQSKYKSLEKMLKMDQLKKNIDSYKDFKNQRERAMMQIREVTRVNNSSQTDLKLPELTAVHKDNYQQLQLNERFHTEGRRNKSHKSHYQFATLQQKRKHDQATDIEKIALLSTRRISLAQKVGNLGYNGNMTIDKWGDQNSTSPLAANNFNAPLNINNQIIHSQASGYLDRVIQNQTNNQNNVVQNINSGVNSKFSNILGSNNVQTQLLSPSNQSSEARTGVISRLVLNINNNHQ